MKIGELCASGLAELQTGPFGSQLHAHEYVPEGVPVVSTESIKDRKIDRGSLPQVSKRKATELARHLLNEGDILFARRGVQATGHAALVGARDKGMLCGTGAIRLRLKADNEIVDSAYLSWVLADQKSISWFKVNAIGGTMPNLNPSIVRAFQFFAPPISEQRAAAEALGDVDALLGGLDRLIAKKRDLKQAAMQQLLTGQTRLPGFSGEWDVKPLQQIAPFQRGFDLPTADLVPGPYPVVYSNGILNHHSKFMVRGPGVVTGRSGTIGRVNFIEQDFWPHNTALWVTNFKGNNPKFVFYLYGSIGLERFGSGTGVPTLNRNDIHSAKLALPASVDEQTAIAAVVSDMDAELEALEQRRAKTAALKQGMMQELLTGRTRLE